MDTLLFRSWTGLSDETAQARDDVNPQSKPTPSKLTHLFTGISHPSFKNATYIEYARTNNVGR
ncbi:MAG: hypothetical protein ABIS36_04285 [Chryseolinea sp.]